MEKKSLIKIYLESLQELTNLEARGFRQRLQEYDFEIKDLAFLLKPAIEGLDPLWKNKYQPFGRLDTKTIGLPAFVIYEALSKRFGSEKPLADQIWESYNHLMNGAFTLYSRPQEIIAYATTAHPEEGLILLPLRSEKALQTGKFCFQDRIISSKEMAREVEKTAHIKWLSENIKLIRETISSRPIYAFYETSAFYRNFQEMCLEAAKLKDDLWFNNNNPALGDWLQEAGLFWHCSYAISKYGPQIDLEVKESKL